MLAFEEKNHSVCHAPNRPFEEERGNDDLSYLRSLQGVPSARALGWIDLDFECSTVCPILTWLMGIWQKRLGKW